MLQSLRARLLAAFLLPTLVLLSAAGLVGFRFSRNVLEEELGTSLSAIAAALASQVSAERIMALEPEDAEGEGSRTWRSLAQKLADARASIGVRRIVAFDTAGKVRLDSGGSLPMMAEMPELARDRLELARVFSGQRAHAQWLFEGNDGRLYKMGYAPLVHDGKVVGALGVEGTAEFYAALATLGRGSALVAGLTLLMLALAAIVSARALSGPLERLVQAALRIGQGDLTTRVLPQPTQEIGVLARELEAMREALESRDRTLKMMLGGVAHEVKNPLGGIELFSGLLQEELRLEAPNTQEAAQHVERIIRELNYLKNIVDDFLAFAREQKLQVSAFSPRELLVHVAELLDADARAKSVVLSIDADEAQVEGDQRLLTSAVLNLVKNAVQASASGGKVMLRGSLQGPRYALEVADEGPGIPLELQSRIFQPFFTTREKGTGLGLPLARKLFEAHHGMLKLTSVPGATTFRGELPVQWVAPRP